MTELPNIIVIIISILLLNTCEVIIILIIVFNITLWAGAASGFGLCTTRQLIEKGCCVIAVDINQEGLEKHFASEKDVHTFKCTLLSLSYYLGFIILYCVRFIYCYFSFL